ncbi:MAG: D-alanyl-D-alanine carboxypeptidase family protein [Caldicoprobacterales bacterium]
MKLFLKTTLFTVILILLFLSTAPGCSLAHATGRSEPDTDDIDISIVQEEQHSKLSPAELTAEGAVLMEQQTGKILFGKHAHQKLYPASTTKILTALLAAEHGDLDEMVTVGEEVLFAAWDGSKAGLDENEEISLRDLVFGLMINSGNDAANTIAVHIARKVSGRQLSAREGLEYFADMMNKRAREAGALHSNFVNAHGYHDPHHYTTPYDLAMICREAVRNSFFREAASAIAMNNTYWNSGEPRFWRSKNKLLNPKEPEYYEYAVCSKTGYTSQAGQCLVTFASKNGMDLVAVVLKSEMGMQWGETRELFEYGFSNYRYETLLEQGSIVETLPVDNYASDDWGSLAVRAASESWGDVFHKDDLPQIKREFVWEPSLLSEKATEAMPRLEAPIYSGQKVGELHLTLRGQVLHSTPLVAVRDVKRKTLLDVLTNEPEGRAGFSWLSLALVILAAFILLRIIVFFINQRRRRRYYTMLRRY